jgi:hypothetical protein
MTFAELLEDLDLGSEVAERDAALARVFVHTTDYREVINDRCDLVIGNKGGGKSAILLMALDAGVPGTDLLPAQDAEGAAVYEDGLSGSASYSEEQYRDRWALHAASIAVRHLHQRHPDDADTLRLVDEIRSMGIADSDATPADLWMATAGITKLTTEQTIQGTQRLLRSIKEILRRHGRSLWVLYDRLDDVYDTDLDAERMILRGLLQAHIHIARYGPEFRTKLFLRNDLLDRATQNEGLRNLDKVRTLQLNMNAWDVTRMVARRLLRSKRFAALTRFEPEYGDYLSDSDVKRIMALVLPRKRDVGEDAAPQAAYGHLYKCTADGTGRFVPRSVLQYLRLAIAEEARDCDRQGIHEVPERPILSKKALDRAWFQLSYERLHNYLYAEFSRHRYFIEKLASGPHTYPNLQALGGALLADGFNIPDAEMLAETLRYCGVLYKDRQGYSVAHLYRPALTTRNPASRSRGYR